MVCLKTLVNILILLNSKIFVDGFEGSQKSTTYLKKLSMKDKLKMLRDYYMTNQVSEKFGKIQLRRNSIANRILSDEYVKLTTSTSISSVDTSGLYTKQS